MAFVRLIGEQKTEEEFHMHVKFEGGATTGEFLEAWNEFESRTDSLITFDPEEIHRLLTNHKELTFGRINLQKNEKEVTTVGENRGDHFSETGR
jgi:hypothetical protein